MYNSTQNIYLWQPIEVHVLYVEGSEARLDACPEQFSPTAREDGQRLQREDKPR